MASSKKKAPAPAAAAKTGAQASANPNVEPDEAPAEILRKITPRHVLGMDVAKLFNDERTKATEEKRDPKTTFDMYVVYGIASGTKSGSTTYGPWEALTGTFEAVRSDGRRFQAGVCFLPNPIGEMLIGALKAQQESDADANIRFALAIGAKYAKKRDGTDGYEFTSREVVKIAQADPLADLRAKAIGYEG